MKSRKSEGQNGRGFDYSGSFRRVRMGLIDDSKCWKSRRSFYPSDSWTMKLKLQNILDETVEIKRADVVTFTEVPGMTVSLKVQYEF